ncbi:hydroxypyruvate isomerase [Corynebacterium suranareeae]|uniref:Hydroxypyruvate isomerase n=1 Tax=Corynebacterium suranareeae TaxID=2506452 RepID=A0A160PRH2_9CORY|nr:hydroxypyruvate isomerase family protein [Corynebacterium suranareeae]BAU96807.1 hydroxypyruvate isomerase [Corynebacterium suranareeae]
MSRFAANLSLTFTELDFLDRFDAAAKHAFSAVEFQYPYDVDAQEIKRRADSAGLPIELFNAPPGDTFGIAALAPPEEFQQSITQAIEYAKVLKPKKLHIMAGIAEVTSDTTARYVENIRWAAQQLEEIDVLVVIEPINQYSVPGYFLHNLDHAYWLVETINHPNVKILFDIFHIQQIHGNLTRRLREVNDAGLLGHVQVASVPDRHEPGTGEVNEVHVFQQLDELGYDGVIAGEYLPEGETTAGLGWLEL